MKTELLGVPLVLALLVAVAPASRPEPPDPPLVIDVAVDH